MYCAVTAVWPSEASDFTIHSTDVAATTQYYSQQCYTQLRMMYISIYLYAYVTYSMHALFPRSRIGTVSLLVFVCAKNVRKGTWIHHYYAYSIHHTCFFRIGCDCCCCFRVVSTIWNPCKMHKFVSSTPSLDSRFQFDPRNKQFSLFNSSLKTVSVSPPLLSSALHHSISELPGHLFT